MTAAEKRAALEAVGEAVPKCECHGEEMSWNRDVRKTSGGFWRCRAKHREQFLRCRNQNLERRRAMDAAGWRRRYHDPANAARVLRQLMRQQLRYHQQRAEQLQKEVAANAKVPPKE